LEEPNLRLGDNVSVKSAQNAYLKNLSLNNILI